MVVLSSDTVVKEVLDKQSAVTNARGDHYLGHDILSGGERMLLMPNGEKWRLQKKLMQKMLNVNVAQSYEPYIVLEEKALLFDLLRNPKDFYLHTKRIRTPDFNDGKMKQFLIGLDYFTELMQTATAALVDVYPILRRAPSFILPALGKATAWHKEETEFYLGLWHQTKQSLEQGTAKPCFAVDILKCQDKEQFTDKFGAYLAGGSMEAGTDTTSNTLYGFIQAMVLFPDAQKKAQGELDRVLGNKFPEPADAKNLPYIRACVKESLRWMPTAIIGAAPHAASENFQSMGYHFPKGALLVNNVYSIHFDPKRYSDPKTFNPARFVGDDMTSHESAVQSDVSKRDHFVFGAGRRLCSGMHVADRELFAAIAGLLWAFDITPAIDEGTGEPILPDQNLYTPTVVCRPQDFVARITPRSAERAAAVEALWKEASQVLNSSGQWKEIPKGMKFTDVLA
ncbi:hypothetical protein LTR78_008097 [Recurvomyces mirabilis]|uniref:Cytochrome P450 n=1 Tax=Recurvomyces mirabilis TaxID=574656 RepID=A0AAE0TRE9_9PEZI|nr:hypothetical protein LTR78_008097 [Recurvomyces mirabilis]KAK5150824.1 hypothetical protein LTS14_009888 [Recurvomyces mirabilis]